MTNKEHAVELAVVATGSTVETAQSVYEAVNKYDWAVFCSYMADYDHPEERAQAGLELDDKLANLKSSGSEKVDELVEFYKKDAFYEKHFHHMPEEYKND